MKKHVYPVLKTVIREYREAEAPITYGLTGLVVGVFLVEVLMTHLWSLRNIGVFATGIFGVHPSIAWTSAPLLHKDILHFAATLWGLLVFGVPLEKHWHKGRFIAFLVLTGYLTIAAGALVLMMFSNRQVAVYGTSGIIYALAGFALTHVLRPHRHISVTESTAVGFGVFALIEVLLDPFTPPYLAPGWINGGHTLGLVIGIAAGWFEIERCGL
jgi:membrane associated rhomboid family serine protease